MTPEQQRIAIGWVFMIFPPLAQKPFRLKAAYSPHIVPVFWGPNGHITHYASGGFHL